MIIIKTNYGAITVELNFDKAPISAANFIEYAKSGFYDGTVFHRVINDFMIQGGGFESGMKQKDNGTPIENEADNGLSNEIGTLAMAEQPCPTPPHRSSSSMSVTITSSTTAARRIRAGAMLSSEK